MTNNEWNRFIAGLVYGAGPRRALELEESGGLLELRRRLEAAELVVGEPSHQVPPMTPAAYAAFVGEPGAVQPERCAAFVSMSRTAANLGHLDRCVNCGALEGDHETPGEALMHDHGIVVRRG